MLAGDVTFAAVWEVARKLPDVCYFIAAFLHEKKKKEVPEACRGCGVARGRGKGMPLPRCAWELG